MKEPALELVLAAQSHKVLGLLPQQQLPRTLVEHLQSFVLLRMMLVLVIPELAVVVVAPPTVNAVME